MKPEVRDCAIREIGCIVCRERGLGYVPCEKHHLLTTGRHGTGKRRGEQATVGLCVYHHRGVGQPTAAIGPSYAREARAFRALYPDIWLLERQEELLAQWRLNTMGVSA